MREKPAKSEKNLISKYQEKGYNSNFYFKDDKLHSGKTGASFQPEELFIVAKHRYEGMSNPSDSSILLVVQTKESERGTLLMAYGPSANMELFEFIEKIPEENISDDGNILLEGD